MSRNEYNLNIPPPCIYLSLKRSFSFMFVEEVGFDGIYKSGW